MYQQTKYGLIVIKNDNDKEYFENNRWTSSEKVDIEKLYMVSSCREKIEESIQDNSSWDCRPAGDQNFWSDPASGFDYGIIEISFYDCDD